MCVQARTPKVVAVVVQSLAAQPLVDHVLTAGREHHVTTYAMDQQV